MITEPSEWDGTKEPKKCPICENGILATPLGEELNACRTCIEKALTLLKPERSEPVQLSDKLCPVGQTNTCGYWAKQQKKIEQLQGEIEGLRDVVKLAYRKHHLDDPDIGYEELSTNLCDALCNSIGDDAFQEWLQALRPAEQKESEDGL